MFEGTPQQIHTLYRGQQISASELKQLKACVGGRIAMISFVSTTKDPAVAEMFAGYGEYRPEIESVIFEIIIDESVHDYERSPFADISTLSAKEDEDEVLLCLGTVLRVESVETREQVSWIRIRMCQHEESEMLKQQLSMRNQTTDKGFDFKIVVSCVKLLSIFPCMTDRGKLQQIAKLLRSSTSHFLNPLTLSLLDIILLWTAEVETDFPRVNTFHHASSKFRKMQKHIQSSRGYFENLGIPVDAFLPFMSFCDNAAERLESGEHPLNLVAPIRESLHSLPGGTATKENLVWEVVSKKWEPFTEFLNKLGQSRKPMMENTLQAHHNEGFSGKGLHPIMQYQSLEDLAGEHGNYEELIRFLRQALSDPCYVHLSHDIYNSLSALYLEQKNWVAVIECCQCIINAPQLPSNSPLIVEAHMNCGLAYTKLADYPEALFSYTKALELQQQHHASRHPLNAELHVGLGNAFFLLKDITAAIEHLEIAITIDSSETTSQYHKVLVQADQVVKHCDKIRSPTIHRLEIQQGQVPLDIVQLVRTYLSLIRIEQITGNDQQRDLYLEQASCVADSSEEARHLFSEEAERILCIPSLYTSLL